MTLWRPALAELRAEFEANGLQDRIWPWLHERLARSVEKRFGRRYDAHVYSPSGEWDSAAFSDLANEFIIELGIKKGKIAYALRVATTEAEFLAYLETALRNFVVSTRPRSMSRNIFERLRDVLDENPAFMRLGGVPPRSRYGLAEWEDNPPEAATDEILLGSARHLPAIKWVSYGKGTRESPGISSDDLSSIAIALFTGLNRLLTAKQIMAAIRQRYELPTGDIERPAEADNRLRAGSFNPLDEVTAAELAGAALETLTDRQRQLVLLMFDDQDSIKARDIGTKLGISKSTAATEMQSIRRQFHNLGIVGEDMERQVLDALWPMLRAS